MRKEVVAVIIIIIVSVCMTSYILQRNELKELRTNYNNLNQTLQNAQKLNEDLRKEREQLLVQSEELKGKVDILEKDIEATAKLIDFYSATIDESIQWFKINNNIKNIEAGFIPSQLKTHCVLMDAQCKIKLGCLPFINDYKNNIKYETDIEAVGKEDFLKNLSLILENKGGDCEDISLLFVAEYNYLVDYCLDEGYTRDEIKLYAYVPDPNQNYHVSYDKTSDVEYYLPKAKPVDVSTGSNYPYIVCGTFTGQDFGHCVVAFADSEIKTSKEIFSKLKNANLIEPQNGMYIGNINQPGIISLYENNQKPFNTYFIYVIIAEDDMYLFNWQYEEKFLYDWIGYHDFDSILFVLKGMLKK